jgi:F0F1-type ATP synthase assembly protein I
MGIGASMAASVLAGLGVGYWLDGKLGTEPLFLLVGSALGILGAFLHLYRTVAGRKS